MHFVTLRANNIVIFGFSEVYKSFTLVEICNLKFKSWNLSTPYFSSSRVNINLRLCKPVISILNETAEWDMFLRGPGASINKKIVLKRKDF